MERLKHVLAQEDTVLFIGSGISIWSGLPSWTSFIFELADFLEANGVSAELVRAEANNGDLLQAASYGFDKLTDQQIGDFIRKACRYGIATPHDIHEKIISLGPSAFITTNYDDLLEQAVRKWLPHIPFRPPVTNRHLTETAEICHARSKNFIFKPHGDVSDTESIILTREQYRKLLPQGDRYAALDSLRTLLTTRPVIYLGFSLRDLDFLYLRDILANTYRGGVLDHYAIMANVTPGERDYWRRNYGIHLISYAATARPDSTIDHSKLMTLLDALLKDKSSSSADEAFNPLSPNARLALARHASHLTPGQEVPADYQIRVLAEREPTPGQLNVFHIDQYDYSPVLEFLTGGPRHAMLIGVPGAGKTYAFRQASAKLAEKLYQWCIEDQFDAHLVIVPLLVDLKLYQGNLKDLVERALPESLSLDDLTQHYEVKLFLDSFNEMPREFQENGSYQSDFAAFMGEYSGVAVIVSSRTTDGLMSLDFPVYTLDQIEQTDVVSELHRLDITIKGIYKDEVLSLLQRPFYFHQIISKMFTLPEEPHPSDFGRLYFEKLASAYNSRFIASVNVERTLSLIAYRSLDRGEEAFKLATLLDVFEQRISQQGCTDVDVREIANWLVSYGVLIPYINGRVAFVHQSFTEYLAGAELARRYQLNRTLLGAKLGIKRWDQALFQTLNHLPAELSDVFLDEVIRVDLALALRAAKYVEVGVEKVVSRLLSEIPGALQTAKDFDLQLGIASAVQFGLPVTEAHERQLRELVELGGMIGAAGAQRLVELRGRDVKEGLLTMLVERQEDYNLCCNGIASALKPYATAEDAVRIGLWADGFECAEDEEDIVGFIGGAAEFLSELTIDTIRSEMVPADRTIEMSRGRMWVLCSLLREHQSAEALELAGELLMRGAVEAGVTIYFIATFSKTVSEKSWNSFTLGHADQLIANFGGKESWSVRALRCLCAARSDVAEHVNATALDRSCVEKAALLQCVSPGELKPVFCALEELLEMTEMKRRQEPLEVLDQLEYDWEGREELFVKLLRLRDLAIARGILGGAIPPTVKGLGKIHIGEIHWWLEWMSELAAEEGGQWVVEGLSGLFAGHLVREEQESFILEFNKQNSAFRQLMLWLVLPQLSEFNTDSLSENAISFMIDDLSGQEGEGELRGQAMSAMATEEFVVKRLLPLLQEAGEPLLGNLKTVLRQVGNRFGRRYLAVE